MYFVRLRPLILGALLLTACTSQAPATPQYVTTPVPATPVVAAPSGQPGYPVPAAESSAYPGPSTGASAAATSSDGRSQSALASYPVAEAAAKKNFDPKAQLNAINPSQIMLGNLGGPPVLPGWFYTFKVPGARRQFIVQVVDGTVTGTTLAEPIEDPKPIERPINVADVKVDSNQVFDTFKAAMAKQNVSTDNKRYDYELVNLEGTDGPAWSVVDASTQKWLFSVNATTGAEIPTVRQ